MKKFAKALFVSLMLVLVASCTTFKASGLAYGKMNDVTVVGDFERTISVTKFLGTSGGATMFNIGQDGTDDKISAAITKEINNLGGDAAVNVSIEQKATVLNMLVNSFTSSILAPVKITIKGTVVKYN